LVAILELYVGCNDKDFYHPVRFRALRAPDSQRRSAFVRGSTGALGHMKNDRTAMNLELRKTVLPLLRDAGFKGSLPHLRRADSDGVDLITFQFDQHGGGFVIEIARGSAEGHTTHWGLQIPAEKLRAWDLHPSERHRIKPREGSDNEAWFRFDRDSVEHVAKQVVNVLPQAEAWWQARAQQRAAGDVRNARA
jgi:hypothetical protein